MSADASALERLLRERSVDWCTQLADEFADGCLAKMSRRTGELADSLVIGTPEESGTSVSMTVAFEAEHARHHDEGTGVYGPEGTRITGNPLLAFDHPVLGLVIVHSVAGAPGTHYWSETVNEWPHIVRRVA